MFIYNVSWRKTLPSDIPRGNRDFQLVNYAHYIRTLSHCGKFLALSRLIETAGITENSTNPAQLLIMPIIITYEFLKCIVILKKDEVARISRRREYFNWSWNRCKSAEAPKTSGLSRAFIRTTSDRKRVFLRGLVAHGGAAKDDFVAHCVLVRYMQS